MWKILESEEILKLGVFRISKQKCEMPDGRIMPRYFVVDFSDWVHVVSITADGDMVLVDQYRHATKGKYLELPGGSTEPQSGESVAAAALRELEEETGYSGDMQLIGAFAPNPALQSNQVHVYLSTDSKKVKPQNLDPYEDLEVKLMPIKDVYQLAEQGKMGHGLMLASLMVAKNKLQELKFL